MKPIIEVDGFGFKAYCKKRNMGLVMSFLKGDVP